MVNRVIVYSALIAAIQLLSAAVLIVRDGHARPSTFVLLGSSIVLLGLSSVLSFRTLRIPQSMLEYLLLVTLISISLVVCLRIFAK